MFKAMHPRVLISALVAPNLLHPCFAAVVPCDGLSAVFGRFESKFRSVHHLMLDAPASIPTVECVEAVSLVFSDVWRRTLQKRTFSSERPWTARVLPIAGGPWSLTFRRMSVYYGSSAEHLVWWLQWRNLAGRPMLRVKLVGCVFRSDEDVDDHDDDNGYSSKSCSVYDFL